MHPDKSVAGKVVKARRIVWEMHRGQIPEGHHPDHIDNDGTNNRLCNLRLARDSQNKCNRTKTSNTSGLKGVTVNRRDGKWRAQIGYEGTRKNLGSYPTKAEAAVVYTKAALQLHGPYAKF